MKLETITNVVGIIKGDVYVDVSIRFLPMTPPNSVEEKLSVDKLNSELSVIGYEINRDIKERINKHFDI